MKKAIRISALVVIALVSILTQANVFNKAGQWARQHQEIIVPLGIAGTAALGAGAHQWYKSRQPSPVKREQGAFSGTQEVGVFKPLPKVKKVLLGSPKEVGVATRVWGQQTPKQQAQIQKGAQELSRLASEQRDLSKRAENLGLKGQEFFKN